MDFLIPLFGLWLKGPITWTWLTGSASSWSLPAMVDTCAKINQRGKKAKVEKAEKRTSLLSSPETETESSDSERRNPEEELTVHLHPNQKEMLLLHWYTAILSASEVKRLSLHFLRSSPLEFQDYGDTDARWSWNVHEHHRRIRTASSTQAGGAFSFLCLSESDRFRFSYGDDAHLTCCHFPIWKINLSVHVVDLRQISIT